MDKDELHRIIERLKHGIQQALDGLLERDAIAQLILLGAIAQEHLLIIGPPGTAKSTVVKRVASVMGGSYFEYLLGKFTEPSELFGTIDFLKLKAGRFETQTEGMLPEANFIFLDEIFLASTAILNTLLGILNERQFRRGHTQLPCPLKICVGASNYLPDEETLVAFADRFLLTYFVNPIADPQLENLLTSGWTLTNTRSPHSLDLLKNITPLTQHLGEVEITAVIPHIADVVRTLRHKGVPLSDRRITKLTKLVAASAILDGRMSAEKRDLWPLIYTIQSEEQQMLAQEALHIDLLDAYHGLFDAAAYEAVGSLASLESVLIHDCETLLKTHHNGMDAALQTQWRTNAAALLKQIDAGFSQSQRSERLNELRHLLIERIQRD